MCALFGWLDYKHIVPYKVLKKLTQALANAAEERGTDASGISYIKDGRVTIFKRPKPAHKNPLQCSRRHNSSYGTHSLNHSGQSEVQSKQPPIPWSCGQGFCICPQRCTLQRPGTPQGKKSARNSY